MKLKLIVALVSNDKTDTVVDAARTGGLDLAAQRDVVLFLVVETRARDILERIRDAGRFEQEPGAGIAFQIPIEDAVGLTTQLPTILEEVDDEI